MRVLDLSNPSCTFFDEYWEDLEVVPLDIYKEYAQWFATQLKGMYGKSGTYTSAFHICMILFVKASASLRVVMVEWDD